MLKRRFISSTHLLRFRRWSRNRFAAFCSVGRSVVIGRLKNSIADASLSKKTAFSVNKPEQLKLHEQEYDPDDETSLVLAIINDLFMTYTLPVVSIEAAANRHIFLYKNTDASVAQYYLLRQMRFFINSNHFVYAKNN